MTAANLTFPISVEGIRRMLPHRYPFLLLDRVVEYDHDAKRVLAYKNVTSNEAYFQGHFPERPVMPGVLVIEAMAQAAGLLTQLSEPPRAPGVEQPLYYLVKVDKARFSRMVVPGDQLMLEVEQKRMLRRMGLYVCRALVDGQEAACAEILCAERSP